jgi:hypothetical protein
LTNANSTAIQPTVFTEYDPTWKNVVSIDELLENTIKEINDLLSTYTSEDNSKLQEKLMYLNDLKLQYQSNSELKEEVKGAFISNIDYITIKTNDFISCKPSKQKRVANMLGSGSCNVEAFDLSKPERMSEIVIENKTIKFGGFQPGLANTSETLFNPSEPTLAQKYRDFGQSGYL